MRRVSKFRDKGGMQPSVTFSTMALTFDRSGNPTPSADSKRLPQFIHFIHFFLNNSS